MFAARVVYAFGLDWLRPLEFYDSSAMDSPPKRMENFSVSRLSDVPAFAPLLASAHAREWGHLYANWSQVTALADFRLEKRTSELPSTWVIHNQTGTLMGSISLVKDDLPSHPGLNPWLASLLVFPEFQGYGLGRVLMQKALEVLRHYRYRHAFLFTEDKAPFFSKFSFSVYRQAQAEGHAVTIMKWTNPETAQD